MPNKKFWSMKAELQGSNKVGHLYLYGDIAAQTWWGDEITPKQLVQDISELGDIDNLVVHLFSGGGDAFAGAAIYSILKQQNIPVTIYVEGMAASAASVIAMAGDETLISRNGMLLLHNPMYALMGYYNEIDMRRMIDDLQHVKSSFIQPYIDKTNKLPEEIETILDADTGAGTWFTAAEAIEFGLADSYIPEEMEQNIAAIACIGKNQYEWNGHKLDLSAYANAPEIKARRKQQEMPETDNKTQPEIAAAAQDNTQERQTDVSLMTYEDGIKAERERIAALNEIAAACPEHADVVNQAIEDGKSYEETSRAVFAARIENAKKQASQGEKFLEEHKADINASGTEKVGSAPHADQPDKITEAAQMITLGMK